MSFFCALRGKRREIPHEKSWEDQPRNEGKLRDKHKYSKKYWGNKAKKTQINVLGLM